MDRHAEALLERFAAAADDIAETSMREVPAFEAMDDARLREGIRAPYRARADAWTFDCNIAVTSATAEACLDTVQGDMLDLNAARRAVIDAAVAGAADGIGGVARPIARATGRARRHPEDPHVTSGPRFPGWYGGRPRRSLICCWMTSGAGRASTV
jgi:hypothetical protein